MTVGIVVFPGSNCDRDVQWALEGCLGIKVKYLWHECTDISGLDAIVLPGGFSYGDYLRCGAIARFAPVLNEVVDFVSKGGRVLGICNGFQVLTELGLLPGALTRNSNLHFICQTSELIISSRSNSWFKERTFGDHIKMPIAHGEGRYQCNNSTLQEMQDEDRILLRYLENPNGSLEDIAGITNKSGNVLGLMPHPERASDPVLGGVDGIDLLNSLLG